MIIFNRSVAVLTASSILRGQNNGGWTVLLKNEVYDQVTDHFSNVANVIVKANLKSQTTLQNLEFTTRAFNAENKLIGDCKPWYHCDASPSKIMAIITSIHMYTNIYHSQVIRRYYH